MSPKPLSTSSSEFEPALARAREGHFAEALQLIERALAVAGSRETLVVPAALAAAAVARLAGRAEDGAAAERALEMAVRLRPQFADLQHEYACVLIARQHRPEARRALEKAIAINPKFAAARVEMAMLDARDGLIGEALASLRALAQEAPVEDARAFSQGIQRLEHADWDGAEALIRRGLDVANAELAGRLERFHALLGQDRAAEAADVLRDVLPRHESYPDLHFLLGAAELRLGHVDDAIASLARALELHPEFHAARVRFAVALDAGGMNAAALDQIALVQQHDPGNAEAEAFLRAHAARGGSATRAGTRR